MVQLQLGIIKEGKNPPDERVPLSPKQCKLIQEKYPSITITVQPSNVRRFKDEEYRAEGIKMSNDLMHCDVLMGVKEVPINDLLPNKTYFFFSHTIKKQAYNRELLQNILAKNIQLIDWETLVDENGMRVIGFGRYAGIVGAYNSFRAWGIKHQLFDLSPAYLCKDYQAVKEELKKVKSLPKKVVITGRGRVAKGILEILEHLHYKKVSNEAFLKQSFKHHVFAQLACNEYAKRKDGSIAKIEDYFREPELFEPNFLPYAATAEMYISGHYWDAKAPHFLSHEDLQKVNLKVVGDISCDIAGPIACTLKPSTIPSPIYGYNPNTQKEDDFMKVGNIAVMAVDNLPCELPLDASRDFGKEIIAQVIPNLLNAESDMIKRATITKNGSLGEKYTYLQDFVDGIF